jgi:hypothetical protein
VTAALYLAILLASGGPPPVDHAPAARLASGAVVNEVVELGRCAWQRSGKEAREALAAALRTGGAPAFYEVVETEPDLRAAIKACQTGTPLSEDDASYLIAAESLRRLMIKNFLDDETPSAVSRLDHAWAAGGRALQTELDAKGAGGEIQLADPAWQTVFASLEWPDTSALHDRRIWTMVYFRAVYGQKTKLAQLLGPAAPPCPPDTAGCRAP